MPFKLPQLPGSKPKEPTLDDVLSSTHQKAELIALVLECTDRMRARLNANFQDTKPLLDEQNDQTIEQSKTEPGWSDILSWSSKSLDDLQKPTIEHFKKWRDSVLHRMQEAMKMNAHELTQAQRDYKVQSGQHDKDGLKGESNLLKIRLPPAVQALNEKDRALVLGAVLFMLLSLENYEAQSRVLATTLCDSLDLPQDVLSSLEVSTAKTLLETAAKASSDMDAEDVKKQKAEEGSFGKRWKVGLATVAGAVVIGVTGGLAAPVILGLAGAIMGGVGLGGVAVLLGAVVNPVTIGALFGVLGGRMSHRAMDAYEKEVEDFKFLAIDELMPAKTQLPATGAESASPPEQKLRCTIGISGWLMNEKDVWTPWRVLSTASAEAFALRYEQAVLISLGTTMDSVLKNFGFNWVRGKAIKFLLPSLAAAMAPYGMLGTGKYLENPFTLSIQRSDKAGKILAQALIDRVQGRRPVTLIGFSMGARVVYSCLQELAARKAYGIIEDAVLIGAPTPSSETSWRKARTVVAGRLLNVYSEKDVLLAYLYRLRNAQLGVAGLQKIDVSTVENLDVSDFVDGHNQYRLAIGQILRKLGFSDLDHDQIEQEHVELNKEKIYEAEFNEKARKEGRLNDTDEVSAEQQTNLTEQVDKMHLADRK